MPDVTAENIPEDDLLEDSLSEDAFGLDGPFRGHDDQFLGDEDEAAEQDTASGSGAQKWKVDHTSGTYRFKGSSQILLLD